MKKELKIKIGFLLFLVALCLYTLWPTAERYSMSRAAYEALRTSDPERYQRLTQNALHLGLDLQGGMHLLLGVRTEEVLDKELEGLVNDVKQWLSEAAMPHASVRKVETRLEIALRTEEELAAAEDTLADRLGPSFSLARRDAAEGDGGVQMLTATAAQAYVAKLQEDALEQVIETLRNRVDELGVAEPQIQRQGQRSHTILVQLPGLKDPDQAKRVIGKVAELQFRIVLASHESPEALMAQYPHGCPDRDPHDQKELYACPDDTIVLPGELASRGTEVRAGYYHLQDNVPASGRDLQSARVGADQYGMPTVEFTIKGASSQAFGRLTQQHLGKQMAIILDGHVKSAPVLQGVITRNGEITGHFTQREAYELALTLRSGALPASVEYLEERTVGASVGDDAIRQGRNSFVVGTMLVVLFMLFYYRRAGLNAIGSLAIAMLMVLAGLAGFGATLTLPGLAGLVLTVGMGVDANVLIFERMRDEKKLGRSVRVAVAAGYKKALSAIADSNITTLLGALLLFQLGTGPVRGFAVTLILGVLGSMFAALYVSRTFFEVRQALGWKIALRWGDMLSWIGVGPDPHIDFFRFRKPALGISAALTLVGVMALGYNDYRSGSILNWGIDFSGGALLQVQFAHPVDISEVRSILSRAGFDPSIQQFGDGNEVLIRTLSTEDSVSAAREQVARRLTDGIDLPFRFDPEAPYAEVVLLPGDQVSVDQLATAVGALGLGADVAVESDGGRVRLRLSEVTARILKALKAHFEPANPVAERRTELVGPQVGKDLKVTALLALSLGLLAQLVYIAFRFELRYALGAILALFHDAWMAITVLAIGYYEINMPTIAAMLTVIGYSVNDTIVVFDRVRENTERFATGGFVPLINASTNEMLSRTILTAGTTLMSSVALWVLGGEVMRSFAVALTVGVVTGTYSSIYIAGALAYYWGEWQAKRRPAGGENQPA
ncbi:MAG: protein translocase subunit SecD [Candidatus Schekmanbacteria bacterium]|nr:protein translocase subunit SecD [Candidatus Schekmanbacteria bacterium]